MWEGVRIKQRLLFSSDCISQSTLILEVLGEGVPPRPSKQLVLKQQIPGGHPLGQISPDAPYLQLMSDPTVRLSL